MDMYLHSPTDQCVPPDIWTCIDDGLQHSVYYMIAVYVSKMAYRPMCTTWELYKYLYRPTYQYLSHDSYNGQQSSVYHSTYEYVSILVNIPTVYVSIRVYRPVCATRHMYMYIYWPTNQCVPHNIGKVYVSILAYRPVCTTQQFYMYQCWPTDQCVPLLPHNIGICINAGLETSVYHTTYGHIFIQSNRPVCTTRQMIMYLYSSTDQCVPYNRWTCI